ncbi:hypothetical protein N7486_002252 [Penicillium sp. IBT 16267x]|nr:hypothetical protein N7486_002252 [Penicillium sp. IBT 16267x]
MALAVILVTLVITLKDQFSPGSNGVGLNLMLTFNQDLILLIRFCTSLETSIGAVSRIRGFVTSTNSEDRYPESLVSPSALWPEHGHIVFHDVKASYHLDSRPVLDDVSLSIQPGEKIAVCGPSGSGKISLILSLLRMIEIREGNITVDGVDVSTLPSDLVRCRINVVPQEPFFMAGTLRFNLDPGLGQNSVSDEHILAAIQKVGLWSQFYSSCDEGKVLDRPFVSSNWSVGERQLLALARALITKIPLLVLDEATSRYSVLQCDFCLLILIVICNSADYQTEDIMEEIIEKEFQSQTVVSVMRRLRFIERFDKILLMRDGKVVEFDTPQALLARPSEFRLFYEAKHKTA